MVTHPVYDIGSNPGTAEVRLPYLSYHDLAAVYYTKDR